MKGALFEFHAVTAIIAGAIGVPGRRTFYLLIGQNDTWLRLWLEKEQLQTLALAIGQLLELLPGYDLRAEPPAAAAGPPADAQVVAEFKVGRLALGYDDRREMLVLYAYEQEAGESSQPILACWATPEQMHALGNQSTAVCAAGRPICRLCGQSIDPDGHMCPRRNGHASARLREELGP